MQARWKKRLAPTTCFNNAYALRKILRSIDEQLRTQLARAVEIPHHFQPRQRTATPDELRRLFAAASPAMRMFLALTSILALRFTEAESLGWSNYDEEHQRVRVKTKGGKIREFPVPDEVAALIHVCPRGEGTFIQLLHGRKIREKHLRELWSRLRKKAGVPNDLHPHDLRRTAAVRVFEITKDVFAAKALLGHDALASTAWYLSPHEPKAMTDAAQALKTWSPTTKERVQ